VPNVRADADRLFYLTYKSNVSYLQLHILHYKKNTLLMKCSISEIPL